MNKDIVGLAVQKTFYARVHYSALKSKEQLLHTLTYQSR